MQQQFRLFVKLASIVQLELQLELTRHSDCDAQLEHFQTKEEYTTRVNVMIVQLVIIAINLVCNQSGMDPVLTTMNVHPDTFVTVKVQIRIRTKGPTTPTTDNAIEVTFARKAQRNQFNVLLELLILELH